MIAHSVLFISVLGASAPLPLDEDSPYARAFEWEKVAPVCVRPEQVLVGLRGPVPTGADCAKRAPSRSWTALDRANQSQACQAGAQLQLDSLGPCPTRLNHPDGGWVQKNSAYSFRIDRKSVV